MHIGGIYSHLNGLEYLQVHKPHIIKEILEVIEKVDCEICRTKESKEKNRKGQMLYSPEKMNKEFKTLLEEKGWHEDRFKYYVTDDPILTQEILTLDSNSQKKIIEKNNKIAYSSYNQTDFVKERTAIEVQFGKYSFVAFDIFVKHMGFYTANKIDIGIEILPTKKLLTCMSSGPSYYERELQHIIRQGRGNPAVPLVIIGIEQN